MRFVSISTLVSLLALVACAGGGASGVRSPDGESCEDEDASDCSGSSVDRASGETPEARSLPRYFTLELSGRDTLVDGEPMIGKALTDRIRREAQDGRNGGAVVRLDGDFSGEVLGAVVWELAGAGFDHIIVSKAVLSEPEPVSNEAANVAPAGEEPGDAAAAAPEESDAEESSETASAGGVRLRTIGLHVGGGPNDDATRGGFVAPIEEHFDELRKCHRLAKERGRNASVGVDLLIQSRGGRAKIQDFRTALAGDEFEECVRGVLAKVEFSPIQRPTVVSYSMLFEPAPR